MKRLLFLILSILLVCQLNAFANGWQSNWYASLRMAGGTAEYLPFWARTGEDGILPVRSSGLITAGGDFSYNSNKGFFFDAGANLVGAYSMTSVLNPKQIYGLVDRAYVSAGWKMLRADVGLRPRHGDLGDLSITGGDIIMSGNARNLPGINLYSDWIYFEKGKWFAIKGNLAHYHMFDDRTVKGAMIHDKSLAFKLAIGRKVDFMAGLHHYAQWGGVSESHDPQAATLRDYMKVFFAKRGDSDDSMSDQLNVFGNHLGNEWIRVVWRASSFKMTFQYDKPFEDNSGVLFKNFPDGVWTLQFSKTDRKALLTDFTYEFINTTWQSGPLHDRPATEEEMKGQDPSDPWYGKISLGGRDHYFYNSPYKSGWTHYGRIIGLPLIVPCAPNEEGICPGILNNRVRGHHVGIAGYICRLPYRFKGTFTQNYGTYFNVMEEKPWQLSMALEADIPQDVMNIPAILSVGVYADVGEMYRDSVGLTLKFSYSGSR